LTITGIILGLAVLLLLFFLWRVKGLWRGSARDRYSEGLRLLLDGEKNRAYRILREVVKTNPDNIGAYLKLGDLLRERGEAEKALRVHKELILRPNLRKDDRPSILRSLALDHIELGQDSSAIMVLEELLKNNVPQLWALENLLPLYEKGGLWDQACGVRQRIAKLKGEDATADLALYKVSAGENLASQGELKKARSYFKEALKLNPQCAAAYFWLGNSYHREERWDEAVEWWKRLAGQIPPKGFIGFKKLEEALYKLGKFGEVTDIYQRILEREPGQRETILALVDIYEKQGKIDEAIDLCERFRDSSQEVATILAKLYAQKGDLAKTQEVISGLLERDRVFVCRWCGYRSAEPLWRCPQCQRWRGFGI